ncbi:unnamed protein product, partial [marine sediment metagenome]
LPGLPKDKVGSAADIAFLFKGDTPETGRALLQDVYADLGCRPIVGIVPNMRVYERASGSGATNAYVGLLVSTVRHCIECFDCTVVLMPHEIKSRPDSIPDDRYLCTLIRSQLGAGDPVFCLLGDYSAELLKAVIGNCDLLIGSRFHSLVAALSQSVPTVALGWSHKYSELMGDVGLEEFAVGFSDVELHQWLAMLDKAWREKTRTQDTLAWRIPELQHSASRALDRAAQIIMERRRLAG